MKLSQEIQPAHGYWYLGSPFTNYPAGHEQATALKLIPETLGVLQHVLEVSRRQWPGVIPRHRS